MTYITLSSFIGVVVSYFTFKYIFGKAIKKIGHDRGVAYRRIRYVSNTVNLLLFLLALISSGLILGWGYKDVGLIFSSVFAVLGVALFAQWSILSNVTASVIVFFFFPYRVGDHVEIIDGDNSIEGTVEEINLFHVHLIDKQHNIVTFPNAMTFQKSVRIKMRSPRQIPSDENEG